MLRVMRFLTRSGWSTFLVPTEDRGNEVGFLVSRFTVISLYAILIVSPPSITIVSPVM